MSVAGAGIATLAGVLSTLSPCVLPLIPVVLGAAVSGHRYGSVALATGLALSFVTIGLFIASRSAFPSASMPAISAVSEPYC